MPPKQFKLFSKSALAGLFQRYCPNLKLAEYFAAAHVFPMRLNSHVVEDLIEWKSAPSDPLFRLSVPQPEMLRPADLNALLSEMKRGDTSRGQYCHAYCTYCFRWAQFTSVGSDQTFRSSDATLLAQYIEDHRAVTDVLFTGGDPLVMPASTLRRYLEPLFGPASPQHLSTIRIGTKSLAWWPYRFVTDPDAKDLLRLFTDVVASGKHLTLQAHFTHPREVEHPVAREAVRLIRMTGAQIRSQAPLVRNINDDPALWIRMWKLQTRLGIVPYYMFVERDTGARDYFSVPLAQALTVFNTAWSSLPGTARTVRGPSMSTGPGKICVLGTMTIKDERYFVLKFLQSRNPAWTQEVFLAKFNPKAVWMDELEPAFESSGFFFEREYDAQRHSATRSSSGQLTDHDWFEARDSFNGDCLQ
ncbi:hypothetical protein TI39_contig4335g00001 [Zymoseptoria brevis]|uniref:Lysine 2,3-aminomutase n=1 Tax=Zymoseptoria brevis TaxID=1047168 RepID=A0A0F4G7H6_9PEZI|nr:hypothetical protein TI39_contig4335g00001 [Zymoseptoria brevis]